jgi:hypothetical protein
LKTLSSLAEKGSKHLDTLLTTQSAHAAFITNKEKNPWLIVDLGEPRKLRAVNILNRTDGGMKHAKNLRVWFSSDKQNWKEVFQAVEAQKEWTVSVNPAQSARYVKIGLLGPRELFTLEGVQVLGEPE